MEKPVSLMVELLRKLPREFDLILDPFAGSGTTLVAAILSGRKAIGWEIDPAYHRIAVSRLSNTDAIPPLFAASQAGLFDKTEDAGQ